MSDGFVIKKILIISLRKDRSLFHSGRVGTLDLSWETHCKKIMICEDGAVPLSSSSDPTDQVAFDH